MMKKNNESPVNRSNYPRVSIRLKQFELEEIRRRKGGLTLSTYLRLLVQRELRKESSNETEEDQEANGARK